MYVYKKNLNNMYSLINVAIEVSKNKVYLKSNVRPTMIVKPILT